MEKVTLFVKRKWKYILTALIAFGIGSTVGPSNDELTAAYDELTAANQEVENVQNQLEEAENEKSSLTSSNNWLRDRVDQAETWFEMTDEQQEQAKEAVLKAEKEAEEQAKREAEEQAKKEAEEQAKKEAEEQARKEAEEQAKIEAEKFSSTEPLTESILNRIVQDHTLTDGDKLSTASFTNGEVKVSIELAPNGLASAEDLAVVAYSRLSDELFFYDGWDVLTVTFNDVGTISMHRSEKETNEFGSYFPTLAIEERLN